MNPMKASRLWFALGARRRSVDLADGSSRSIAGKFDGDHRGGLYRG